MNAQARDAKNKELEAWKQVSAYTVVVESLKAARKNQEWYQKHLSDLSQDLKERSESDEWLQQELDQYEERMRIYEQRQQEQVRRFDGVKRDIAQVREKQSEKRVEAGKHEQKKATHEQKVRDRGLAIKQSAREHNIWGFDTELGDVQISEYLEKITKISKEQNAKVEKLRNENIAEIQKVQLVLDDMRERRSALQEGKRSTKDQIVANERKISSLHSQLNTITMDEGAKAAIESNIEDLEDKLKKSKQEMIDGAWEKRIDGTNAELRALEEQSAALNRDLIQGTKQAGNLARLDHLKKELKERQRSLDTMSGAHNDRLRALVGPNWQANTVEAEFQRLIEERKQQVSNAERQRDSINRELEHIDFKLKTSRADLKKKEKDLEACTNVLKDITDGYPEAYPEVLAQLQHDRDTRKADVDNYAALKSWYTDCIETAKSEEPACRLCARPFHDERSIKQFIKKLEARMSKAAFDGLQKELKDLDTELQAANHAGTNYDTWKRLSEDEIPSIKADIEKLDQSRQAVLADIEKQDFTVNEKIEALRDAETLVKPVANIVKYKTEQSSFQLQIEELVAKQQDAGDSRMLEDLQEEIEGVSAKSRSLRNNLIKLQNDEKRSRAKMTMQEVELGKVRNQLTTANHELEKRENILAQVDGVKKSTQDQQNAMNKLDGQLQSLLPQFAEQEAKRDDIKRRGDDREKELQRKAKGLSESVSSLQRSDQEIRAYEAEGGPSKLINCQKEIQNYDQDIASLEAELKQITVEINKIREELGNQDQNKRIINDNLKYRKTSRELQAVKDEIEKLSAQNAEADQEHHRKQAEKFGRQHNLLSTEETSKVGTMKAKDDQLLQLLNDWNTDYKDAAIKYKRSHIEVETSKAAVEDLGRYGSALDKAIMKYHSLKMEEINRIVEELWKRTYQGTDVDTILIRSDNETGKGNRSYNYRVCMVKQDAEMDMRGRCSAGQKVLASIIIRLALAECFGVNCGLIALDEPTTNLDRDNIRALADSLHHIIKARQQQANFQLIVITHDEDFLRYMRCADFCDNYWRVSRNERQKSIIERQSIAEVM